MAIRWTWLDRILRRSTNVQPPPYAQSVALHETTKQNTNAMRALRLTSPQYQQHISGPIDLEEAARRLETSRKKGPQNLSMAWDDNYSGLSGVKMRDGIMDERDRKDTYYKTYLGNSWVGACIDVISKRITSGGWEIEEVEQGKGNQANADRLKAFLLFVNEDEDFLQFLRAIAADLLIFGEAFCEIVYGAGGVPAQLHKIDCITMSTHLDQHGMVTGYTQSLDKARDVIEFEPDQIIRWWLPDPRASKKALSPIERIKDAVYLHTAMTTWAEKFFKQGARPGFSIQMGDDSSVEDASRYIKFYKENYMGIQNAHVPPVLYNGAKLVEFGHGSVDMDFLQGRDRARNEILAGYGVLPAMVGVIETGNIGGGTGESQEKAFQYNTTDPIKQIILEKLNYRIVQKAFGIEDWILTTRYADFRNDGEVVKINDTRIRNGSRMINEVRQEEGKPPYVQGGDVPVFAVGREVMPISDFDTLSDTNAINSRIDIQTKQTQLDSLKQSMALEAANQAQQPQGDRSTPSLPDGQQQERYLYLPYISPAAVIHEEGTED